MSFCDSICVVLKTKEVHYRPSSQGFYWGLFAQCIPNFTFSERKQVCVNSLVTASHSDQLRNGGNPPKIQVAICQLRTNILCWLFLFFFRYSSLRHFRLTIFCIPFDDISFFFSEGFLLVFLIKGGRLAKNKLFLSIFNLG